MFEFAPQQLCVCAVRLEKVQGAPFQRAPGPSPGQWHLEGAAGPSYHVAFAASAAIGRLCGSAK